MTGWQKRAWELLDNGLSKKEAAFIMQGEGHRTSRDNPITASTLNNLVSKRNNKKRLDEYLESLDRRKCAG